MNLTIPLRLHRLGSAGIGGLFLKAHSFAPENNTVRFMSSSHRQLVPLFLLAPRR